MSIFTAFIVQHGMAMQRVYVFNLIHVVQPYFGTVDDIHIYLFLLPSFSLYFFLSQQGGYDYFLSPWIAMNIGKKGRQLIVIFILFHNQSFFFF